MLKRDFASTTRQIGSPDIMINQPHFMKDKDWGSIIGGGLKEYNRQQDIDALTTALQAEDEEQIADAWAKVDPMGYAQRLDQMKQARLDREQQLEDDELKFQRQLALKKAGLDLEKTYDITPQMKNIKYLVDNGEMTLQEAIDLVYDRNKPTNLSPYEKELQKQQAKAEADKSTALSDLDWEQAYMQNVYDTLFKEGGIMDKAYLGYRESPLVAIGQRYTPTAPLNEEIRKARQQVKNIMGGLRLDQTKYLKGAISDTEQKFLSDVVAGDITKYSPAEMQGTFENILNKLALQRDFINKKIPTKAQQIQQGLSQIVPQEEQMSRHDFSKQGKINYGEIYGF